MGKIAAPPPSACYPVLAFERLCPGEFFSLHPDRRKILAITLEPVAKQMAGPAIRCLELAKQLSDEFAVTVFSPRLTQADNCPDLSGFASLDLVTGKSKTDLYNLADKSDILFIQGNVLKPYPALAKMGKYLVVDLYDPYLLSVLAQFHPDSPQAQASYNLMHKVLEAHMVSADFSLCASERQRDYWLGRYCSLGRLNPAMYKIDPGFRKLIDVVPFGLPDNPPLSSGSPLKGRIPGIEKDDFVLLWGGGIWEWFDPLTVIRATGRLAKEYPRLKLYFMGFKSPNPQVPLMDMAVKARALAAELGILDRHVFFSDSWTSYEERVNYLLDADAAVSAHFDSIETRFSFRTRILDYLWAGLPILTTCGDQLAEMIQAYRAGQSLPYGDVEAWEQAIGQLLRNKELCQTFRLGAQAMSSSLKWSKVVKPLADFCLSPYKLPAYEKVKMPSLAQRARAVYSRGGKNLVLKRSKEILQDILRH